MWLFYALLAGVLYTVVGLLTRHLLRGNKDAWAYSFYFSLVGALVSLPFMLADPVLPAGWRPWALALVVGALIVGNNLLFFKAANHIEASLSGAISKFRLVWVFVLSVAVAQTAFSWPVLVGTLLTVAAGLVVIHHFRQPRSLTGVLLVFASTILYAVTIILYKYLFASFGVASATFFAVFLVPAILNFALMPRATARIKTMFKENWKIVGLATGFGALANLAMNQGLSLGSSTAVLVIIEAFLVLTLVGEHIFLKEKEMLWVKITAVLLAVAGAVLIRLYG